MDNVPSHCTLLSSNAIPQALVWPFAQGLDNSWDCFLAHTSQGEIHSPHTSEDSRLQCALSMPGDGRPTLYSGLEELTPCQPHLRDFSTLFPQSGQIGGTRVYNGPNAQFMNTRVLHDRCGMQGHTGEILHSDGQEDVSKCARLPLVPWISAQARMEPYHSVLCAQQSRVSHLSSMDDCGMMAPTTKPLSALQHFELTACHPCGWIKEDGTRCNTHITYDCARHLATAHNIRQQGRRLKVLCCWCDLPRYIRRSSMLRHVREVHLKCSRSSPRIHI